MMGLAMGVELVGEPRVSVTASNAVRIEWRTDVSCGTRLVYGAAPDQMRSRVGEGVATEHEVSVTGLTPGQTYHFAVGTARFWFVTNSFTLFDDPGRASAGSSQRPASAESPRAPPASRTWGDFSTLKDHFERHGSDVRARTAEEYAAMAWGLRQRAIRENWRVKRDERGTVRIFDPRSGVFGAYRSDGRTRTFFKPNSSTYFTRQPGEIIDAGTLAP